MDFCEKHCVQEGHVRELVDDERDAELHTLLAEERHELMLKRNVSKVCKVREGMQHASSHDDKATTKFKQNSATHPQYESGGADVMGQ